MAGYLGVAPVPQATTIKSKTVATDGQTVFAVGSYTPGFIFATLNGVEIDDGDDFIGANGSDIVLLVPAAAGDVLKTIAHKTFEVANVSGGGMYQGNNGTVGTRAGDMIRVNSQTLSADVTIAGTHNASVAGPLEVANGVTLTVEAGGSLSIV